MHAQRWFLLVLLVSCLAEVGVADEPTLLDRFTIPQQGHLELEQAVIPDLDGVNLGSVADVIRLRDKIEAIPFDRQNILSWNFLDQVGLNVEKIEIPPSPPGVKIELVQGPAWTKIEIDYTADSIVNRMSHRSTMRINANSPVARVSVYRNGNRESIDHSDPNPQLSTGIDPGEVFTRSTHILERPHHLKEVDEHSFYVFKFERGENWILTDKDQDAILASIFVLDGKVTSCSLHCYLQESDDASSFRVPRLILELNLKPNNVCHATMFFVDKADFKSSVKPEQLQVPAIAGATLTYRLGPQRYEVQLPGKMDDLLHLSPDELHKLISENGKP